MVWWPLLLVAVEIRGRRGCGMLRVVSRAEPLQVGTEMLVIVAPVSVRFVLVRSMEPGGSAR
jgi:hypothetical protein